MCIDTLHFVHASYHAFQMIKCTQKIFFVDLTIIGAPSPLRDGSHNSSLPTINGAHCMAL
jgi:hypothetical protein